MGGKLVEDGEVEPPFPWVAMGFVSLGMLAHSIVFTSPLPYVAFMVVDFHMSDNLDTAGYTAGWITGMFMVGRTIAGIPWGMAADRYGRKPCLVISMANVAIFGLLFGFAQNFYFAVAMRFCIGLGNGFMGVAKTTITEFVSCKAHEVRAFGYLNGVWGLGLIVGPAIGGLLARPAIQYPDVFDQDGLWGRYPYLLPSLVCAIIAMFTGIGIALFMPETLHMKQQPVVVANPKPNQVVHSPLPTTDNDDDEEVGIELNTHHSTNENGQKKVKFKPMTGMSNVYDMSDEEDDSTPKPKGSSYGWNIAKWKLTVPKEVRYTLLSQSQSQPVTNNTIPEKKPDTLAKILASRNIQIVFAVYLLYCFLIMFVDETFPLWCVTSINNGGLSWTSAEVGETLAMIGFGLILYQVFVYEWMMKKYFNTSAGETYYRLLKYTSLFMILLPFVSDLTIRWLRYNYDRDDVIDNTSNDISTSSIDGNSTMLMSSSQFVSSYVTAYSYVGSHGGTSDVVGGFYGDYTHSLGVNSHLLGNSTSTGDEGKDVDILNDHHGITHGFVLRAAIVACWLCYRLPATAAFSTLAILVNSSVDQSMRGTMNGLIMTAGSLGNGAGPIIGSALYAFALNLAYGKHVEKDDHDPYYLPIDGRFIFVLGGLMTLLLGYWANSTLVAPDDNRK